LIGLGALFGLLYFVQGIVEPTDGLLSQPIKSLLRNWNYTAAATAWFIAILSLAWTIKPLYGLLTDFVPLAGSQRRGYLLLTTAIASISMTAVYFLPLTSERAVVLLILLLPSAVAIAFSDVVIDAMMVNTGQQHGMTGRLQSVQWSCMYAAMIGTGVVGGALSQRGMQQAGFLIAALCCGVSLVAVWTLVSEPSPTVKECGGELPSTKSNVVPASAKAGMRQMLRQPGVVAIGAFLFLWNFNPFSSAVLYYYSIGALHFSEQFVGTLTSWHAAGLLAGSVLYPTWPPNPRFDCHRHFGHDWLLGVSRPCERHSHKSRGGRSLCDRIAHPTRSGRARLPAGNGRYDICTANVAVESERRAVARLWRIDLRCIGAVVGNGIGISTIGCHRGAVYCGLLVIDTALEASVSITDKGCLQPTSHRTNLMDLWCRSDGGVRRADHRTSMPKHSDP
jgi:hypothetical protein